MSYKVIHTIYSLLFPIRCIGCKEQGTHICLACSLSMQRKSNECFFCAIKTESQNICERCIKHSPIADIWWSWRYQNEKTKKIIATYKYRKKQWLAPILSRYIQSVLDMHSLPSDTVVIPVPLSSARQRERGFNQALILAKNLPFQVLDSVVIRTKDSPSQARTHSRAERINQMRGAFSIKNPAKIAGKTILLIDDVATTGATLCELAVVLKKAGSGQIYAAVLAHG